MHIRQNSIVKALRAVKHVNSGTIEPVTTKRDNHTVRDYRYSNCCSYSDRSTNQIVCDTQNMRQKKNLVTVL